MSTQGQNLGSSWDCLLTFRYLILDRVGLELAGNVGEVLGVARKSRGGIEHGGGGVAVILEILFFQALDSLSSSIK
ncbi:unnamed protein product [Camellia sinensis]